MTIESEARRIKSDIEAAYLKLEEKGATLPSVHNATNLAETINSVPSGGGGGYSDFSETEFRSACAELEKYMPTGSTVTTEAEHNAVLDAMQSNGWIMMDGKEKYINSSTQRSHALLHVLVTTFSYNTKYVWFCSRTDAAKYPVAFKLPSNAELVVNGYDDVTASNRKFLFCVKFNGEERTILFSANPDNGTSIAYVANRIDTPPYDGTYSNINYNLQYAYPPSSKQLRAIKYYDINPYPSSSNPEYWGMFLENMISAKIIESGRWVSYQSSGKRTVIPDVSYVLSRIGNVEDLSFLKDFYSSDFYDDDLGIIKTLSDKTFWNTSNLRKYLLQSVPDRSVFPVIIDLSADTGTGTWQPFNNYSSFGGYINGIYMYARTVYIKLPSNYTTVDLNGYASSTQSNGKSSPCLTLESWQYMADNAPTVSGKTLKVGNQVYHMMKTWKIPEYVSIANTFEGKGWKLAAN